MAGHRSYRSVRYDFGKELLTLRTRLALTQSELANYLDVHRRSVQNWETGESYPKADTLQRIIAIFLSRRAFTASREHEEALALWQLAAQDGSNVLPNFDEAWFAQQLATTTGNLPTPAHTNLPVQSLPARVEGNASAPIIDWGEIPAISALQGRDQEIELLQSWIKQDHCRVVTILGLGGIGKSSLAITVARHLAVDFDTVLFRSLQNGPSLAQVLDQILRAVANEQTIAPESLGDKISLLVRLFRERRCLLILDNFETVLQPGTLTGNYRTGYDDYGALLSGLSEREHQSCLLLTSREKPAELGPLEGRNSPVRVLRLSGLADSACQSILEAKDIRGSARDVAELVRLFGGNPLALNIVAEPIRELFGGDVGAFLATGDAFFNGMGKLLDQQFARSTPLEQQILYWLAIEREFTPFDVLLADIGESMPQRDLLSALESLRRRMLIERSLNRPAFALQPVILEYVTERLIWGCHQEVMQGLNPGANRGADQEAKGSDLNLLQRYALVKATAKENVRRSQEQLIAAHLLEHLVASCGSAHLVEGRLLGLLAHWRDRPHFEQAFGPGNVVNLLRLLHGHVNGLDLSNLALRHVYLQGVMAHDTNFTGSHLIQSVFQEPYAGIESVACSPDMRYMAAGTVNGEIRLWEVANRTTLLAVKAHTGPVVGLALSRDGELLASGSADGTIRLWDVATGDNLAVLHGHTSVVWSVALSSDRRLLVSGSGDGTVRLWNIENVQSNGNCFAILEGHTSAVRTIALSLDGRLLVSGSFDGTVRLWDIAGVLDAGGPKPISLAILKGHSDAVRSVAISADGQLVASGSVDHSVRLWDTAGVFGIDGPSPPCVAILTGHNDAVRSVALSADGRLLASGSGDRTVRLWDLGSGEGMLPSSTNCFAVLEGHTNAVMSLALAAGGELLASGSTDGTVRLWEVGNAICIALMEGHTNAVMSLALARDGKRLASGGTDGKIRLWNVERGLHLATLQGHTNMAMGVAFSGDGALLASASGDATLRLWDVSKLASSTSSLKVLRGHTNVVRGIAWSSDGRLLASASYDGTVRLWDIENELHLCTLIGHTNMVMSVALSQDGRLLASGSFDGTVRLWDTSSMCADSSRQGPPQSEREIPPCIAVLRAHSAVVYGVALSSDGRWLASCSFDRTVRLWDTTAILNGDRADNEDSFCASHFVIGNGYDREAWSVALSADGKWLAAGATDGSIALWEAESVKSNLGRFTLLEGHSSAIWSVTLSTDGGLLVSGSGDGTVRLWQEGWQEGRGTILRAERPYERMKIGGLTGITEAQRASLVALGAI